MSVFSFFLSYLMREQLPLLTFALFPVELTKEIVQERLVAEAYSGQQYVYLKPRLYIVHKSF